MVTCYYANHSHARNYQLLAFLFQKNYNFQYDHGRLFLAKWVVAESPAIINTDWVYNWMVDFFEHRKHRVVFDEEWSEFLEILASIIQGSGIGPASYVVNAGDLRMKNQQNKLVKFADDTYLIVPSSMEETRMEEITNISEWATRNNLTLNNSKTVEIVFSRPRSRRTITPPALIPGIVRSESMKMLGVTISNKFSVSQHIEETVSTCARALIVCSKNSSSTWTERSRPRSRVQVNDPLPVIVRISCLVGLRDCLRPGST